MPTSSNTLRERVFKLLFIFITAVFICIGALFTFFTVYLNPLVKAKLIDYVSKSNEGTFRLKIEDIDISPFKGAVTIKNISLHQKKSDNLFLSSKAIHISDFQLINYIRTNKVRFDKLSIDAPDLILKDSKNNTARESFEFLLPRLIANLGGSLQIKSLTIRDGTVQSYSEIGDLTKSIGKIDLQIKKLRIDTLKTANSLQCHDAIVEIEDYNYRDCETDLQIESAKGSLTDSLVVLKDVAFKGSHEKVKITSVKAEGIDLRKILLGNSLNAREISLDAPNILYISSKIKQGNTEETLSSALQKILKSSYHPVKINTLKVSDGKFNISLPNKKQLGEQLSLRIKKILLDTLNLKGKYFEDLQFNFKNYGLLTQEKSLSAKTVDGSYKSASITMNRVNFQYGKEKNKKDFVHATVKNIRGDGVNFNTLLSEGNISASKIRITNPELDMHLQEGSSQELNLKESHYKVNELEILDGKILLSKNGNKKIQSAAKINVKIDNLNLDNNFSAGKWYSDIHFTLKDYILKDALENIKATAAAVEASKKNAFLLCHDIKILSLDPNAQKYTFSNSMKYLSAEGFDLFRFLEKEELVADRIIGNKFKLEINRKNSESGHTRNFFSYTPQEMVQQFESYFNIKNIDLSDASFIYTHRQPGTKAIPVLSFQDSRLQIQNLSNAPSTMTEKNPAKFHLESKMMGKGSFVFDLTIPLLSKNVQWSYSGRLSNIEGKEFNQWFSLADLQVKKGIIDDLTFTVHVQDETAGGNLKMLYHDFKLNLLNKKTGRTKKVYSGLANLFLNKKNVDTKYRSGEMVDVSSRLYPEDNFFYSLWHPVRLGMVNTVSKELVYFPEE